MSAIDELPVRILYEGNYYLIDFMEYFSYHIICYKPVFFVSLRKQIFEVTNANIDTAASELLTKLKEAKII